MSLGDWIDRVFAPRRQPSYSNWGEIQKEENRMVAVFVAMVKRNDITLREVEAEFLGIAYKFLLNKYQIDDPYMHARIAARLTSRVEREAVTAPPDDAAQDGAR